MIFVIEALLALAYGVLAHLASASGDDLYALGALLALVAMMLAAGLAARRMWALATLPLSLGACWWLYAHGHASLPLLLVPVVFIAVISWWFARSLRSPHGALITRIVAAIERVPIAEVPDDLRRYTRALSAAWALVLGGLALLNLVLALVARPGGLLDSVGIVAPVSVTREQWSWCANLLNYGIVGGFFALEFRYRQKRFPGKDRNFLDFARKMAGLGPAFWRGFLR